MNVIELDPVITDYCQFSFREHKFVPKESGCYVLANFNKEILYIGKSEDLYRRFAEHRDNKEKTAQTSQGTAFWFFYLPCDTKEVFRIERTWLNEYATSHGNLPPLNKIQSPVC
jgi:excinuclease UvrABC nuclease subunit